MIWSWKQVEVENLPKPMEEYSESLLAFIQVVVKTRQRKGEKERKEKEKGPIDRVFAKIEKELRKKEIVTDPQQYVNILQSHGRIFNLSQEVIVYDFKKESSDKLKPTGF